VKGLIDLMGIDFFNQRLDSILTESEKNDFGGGKNSIVFRDWNRCITMETSPVKHISMVV